MWSWVPGDPGEGDVPGLRSMMAGLSTVGTGMVGVQASAFGISGVMERYWSGDSHRAWLDGPLWSVSVRASGVIEGCEAARGAVSRYVTVLEEIGPQYAGYRDRLAVLHGRAVEHGLACHRDGAGYVRCMTVGPTTPGAVTAGEVEELESDATWAVRRIDELVAEREGADRRLVDELAAAVPAGWAERRAAYAAIGVLGSDDLGAEAVGASLAAYLGGEALVDGRLDATEVEHALAVLRTHGGDEAVLKVWVRQLGPEQSVRVLEAAGMGIADGTLDPAQSAAVAGWLRLGVSVASRDWTAHRSDEFAQGLVEAARVGGYWSVLGYLFDDPENVPMGRGLTLAMADSLDELERTDPGALAQLADGGFIAAGVELSKVAPGGSEDTEWVREPAGRVLQTLALYPQDAADWLTDDTPDPHHDGWTTGQARVDFWFKQRDSKVDGFAGVASLWAGAQHVLGGPADPDRYDERAWEQVATLNTWVFDSLTDNVSLRPQHVSADASESFAEVIGLQLPFLAEYPLTGSKAGWEESSPSTQATMEGRGFTAPLQDGTTRVIADVNRGDLGDLAAIVMAHPQGSERFKRDLAPYQGWIVDRAVTDQTIGFKDALRRIVGVQALYDGGPASVELMDAADTDASRRQIVASAATAVGAVSVPGKYAGSYAWGLGVGKFAEFVATSWADEYQREVEELPADCFSRAAHLRTSLDELMDQAKRDGVYQPSDDAVQARDVDELVALWEAMYADVVDDPEACEPPEPEEADG